MAERIKNQEIAQSIANSDSFLTDLVYCSQFDSYYIWKEYYFKQLELFELKKLIHLYIFKIFPKINITDGLIIDIIKSIRYHINTVRTEPDYSRVAFLDKNFNLDNFRWEEHSKQNLTIFNFAYNSADIEMETPNWDNFLKTSLVKEYTTETDVELIDFVQEMFGYFLLSSLQGSSAFFLLGQGSNGKSVMVKVLEEMFSKEYCSNMSIQALTTDKFMTAHLVGKKINLSSEDESKFMRSDTFKALITGDTITAQRKFGDAFSFTPNTKFLIASNEMPTFDAINYGLKRRIKFIPFYRIFKDEEQDKELQNKLSAEIPGIIAWAIDGAKRFIVNGRVFNQAQSSIISLNKFVDELATALVFFRDNFVVDDSLSSTNYEIYKAYTDWCLENGRKAMNSNNFWKDIKKEYGANIKEIWLRDLDTHEQVKGKNIGRISRPPIEF